MSRVIIFFGLLCLVLGACVPNKKILYLQTKDELKEEFPTDTVLRTYNLADYEYRIQPEDILSIRVESLTDEEYDIFAASQQDRSGGNQGNLSIRGYLVDKKGEINLPEIGAVHVGGLTLHEIEVKLTQLAAQYVEQPTIRIRLLNYRVTVLGEVVNEGVITSFDNRMTIMEAIGKAGGIGELADRSKVKIIRQYEGQSQVLYVNLLDEGVMKYDSFFTYQNDIIIVPPLKQRPFRRYFGQNLSLFVSTVSVILLTVNLITK